MITVDDLQEKRSPSDLHDFVVSTSEAIRADSQIVKLARLKQRPFKEFTEEVYPLSIYSNLKYSDNEVICYPVIGNQGYDAIIESPEGKVIESVEFTWPIDGQKQHFQVKEINEKGHSTAEVWDVNDNSRRIEIIDRITQTAHSKALKDYTNPEGASLVFILDIAPYFGMRKLENKEEIDILISRLRDINFRVNSVFLLLLPINELIQIK